MATADDQAFLATPKGILLVRVCQTLIKGALIWASTKFPKLGLGANIDAQVQLYAPAAALAACAWWTKWQHDHDHAKHLDAVDAAVNAAVATMVTKPTVTVPAGAVNHDGLPDAGPPIP